jgi:hypothetical protein
VEYRFEFEGTKFSRIMYLPYVGEAGTIWLSGSHYVMSPVLADRVISITEKTVFFRLLKTRLTFNRASHDYMTNFGLESQSVVWATVYNNKTAPVRPTVKAETTMVHYLLCVYGFTGMFTKYLNISPIVGGEEINEENYPKSDWVICYSTTIKPRGVRMVARAYRPSTVRVAVKRSEYTPVVKQLLAGYFYIVDHFPQVAIAEYAESTEWWKTMMGRILWGDEISRGKILNDLEKHFNSLAYYIDPITSRRFQQINHPVRDVYEMFFLVIVKYAEWMGDADNRVTTMYDKELSILPFICSEYIAEINRLGFKLADTTTRPLSLKHVQDLFSKFIRLGIVFSLSKDSGLLSTASTSGDCMAFKLTNILVPQHASSKSATSRRTTLDDPSKQLDSSIAEVAGFCSMPKSAPDGRSRLNLCVNIDPTGLIVRNEELRPLTTATQAKILLKAQFLRNAP